MHRHAAVSDGVVAAMKGLSSHLRIRHFYWQPSQQISPKRSRRSVCGEKLIEGVEWRHGRRHRDRWSAHSAESLPERTAAAICVPAYGVELW